MKSVRKMSAFCPQIVRFLSVFSRFWMCYIYNGQRNEENKNTSALKSIFFCKRIKVNEASAYDLFRGHESGAFLLPKINQPADDDPRLTTKERKTHLWIMKISKRDSLRT